MKTFNFENGKAICTIKYKNKKFYGEAQCHPEDKDFESERVGLHIADIRADMTMLRYIRDVELIPDYNTLNHLCNSFKNGAKYNENSNESKLVRKQLYTIKKQLCAVRKELAHLQLELTVYIKDKEKFYQHVRKSGARGQKSTISLT